MKRTFPLILCFALFYHFSIAQPGEVVILTSGQKTSLRGLSVVNDNVIWVSGSNGTVGRSNNSGKNWNWFTVKGFEKTEFRDIEGFDAHSAVIMSIAEPAYILKTSDGGETWRVVYENKTKGMFLDAMDFLGDNYGIVIGDPIDGKVFVATTIDNGDTWSEKELWGKPMMADSGEAFFAASGTNIRYFQQKKFFIVSGGTRSRLFTHEGVFNLPIIQGKETTGANSVAVYDRGMKTAGTKIVVVGGDFAADSSNNKVCFYSTNGGKSWDPPKTPPHGYRSCVEYLSKNAVLACGLNGVDYSSNSGKDWQLLSKEGFNVCRIAKFGSQVYLAGNNGKIAKILWK
jgi:photosystem II stability/assembly factor-like uncharacterized protein